MDTIEKYITKMSLDEKIQLLSGINDVYTKSFPKHGIKSKAMADGPHGLRLGLEKNCTLFPNLCALAATWNTETAEKMGEAYGDDCLKHNIDMVFGPGCNIKRTPLCGRNFEYFSEDPVVSGELASGYIKGIQKKGISACLKHFAANNQEKYRCSISVDVDERTLREIYLKPFEIAVKKANPDAIMCAYNKINSVWCSENPFLLTEILRNEWNYSGFVISDYNAVHNPIKALNAGLDYHFPPKDIDSRHIKEKIEKGEITTEELDRAVKNILRFATKPENNSVGYNRDNQHRIAREIAAEGIVLLKNDQNILPLSEKKYNKIALIGEFAENPMIAGQGSSEVNLDKGYIDSPFYELKKLLPNAEIGYREVFKKGSYSETMLWPQIYSSWFDEFTSQSDIVIVFAGSMQSEDTEMFDRRTIELNPNYERFIQAAAANNKKVVLVLQTASVVDLSRIKDSVSAIVQMWFGGEAAGGAIADVLCGVVNPSGKLPETFPNKVRVDMDYPGNGYYVSYNERLDVGYRYYDRHPDEICYPFGYGLSYTTFEYSNISVVKEDNGYTVSFKLKNAGKLAGAEVVQLYISDSVSTMPKPLKELKQFKKVFLNVGEEQEVVFNLTRDDFSYYNTIFHQWIAENGLYKILIGASSQDIRLTEDINYTENMPYTTLQIGDAGVSDTSTCFM